VGLADAARRRPGGALAFGFALATFGGPLALSALLSPHVAGPAIPSLGLATLVGAAIFALPIVVWWRFSEDISSAGGLAAFVREAAGRRAAIVQGAIWSISYFLYLPYTVSYIVYDQLPELFPGIGPYRWVLQLVLPLAITAIVLLPLAVVFALFGAIAIAQLVLLLALGIVELAHADAIGSSFGAHSSADPFAHAALGIGLLFICGSLPLFFADEVRGGGRTIRLAIAAGFGVTVAYVLFANFPLAGLPGELLHEELPGAEIATDYVGRWFGVVVGLGIILSTGLLILAEFMALARLLHYASGRSVRTTTLAIAVPFLLVDALALIDAEAFYEKALRPSLVALWASQLIVFVVYPLWRRRRGRLVPSDWLVAACSAAFVAWGLYLALTKDFGS
jgi:amino acid transporter